MMAGTGVVRFATVLWLVLSSLNAHAVIKPLSRANCIGWINESVTYDRPFFVRFQGSAASYHTPLGNTKPKHEIGAQNNGLFAARFYAGDASDPERMAVRGFHTWIDGGGGVWRSTTSAVDCNLTEW